MFLACLTTACSKMAWGVIGGEDRPMIFPAMLASLAIWALYFTVRLPNQLEIPYLKIDSMLAL